VEEQLFQKSENRLSGIGNRYIAWLPGYERQE